MLGLDGSYEGQDMTAVPYHPDLKYLGFFYKNVYTLLTNIVFPIFIFVLQNY
jgi:hypothetical protein